jgi:23S rRNA (guanosine2251-2'-O)-methyltransferase
VFAATERDAMSAESNRLVVGLQPVREALRAHQAAVREVWLQANTPRLAGLGRLSQSLGVSLRQVSRAELDRASKGAQHQGALAWAPALKLHTLENVLEAHDLILALDGIVDPQNFGAAIRSAVGLGQAPVVWAENASAPLTPATFRASAGAVEHARLCRVHSLPLSLQLAAERGFRVVGLDAHAGPTLQSLPLTERTLVVLGSEAEGLSKPVRRVCHELARLTDQKLLDSLNASVAAAIALYEVQRQRALSGHVAPPTPPLPAPL